MFISVCCDAHLLRDVYCMLFFSVRLADYEIIRGASRDPAGVHICDLSQNDTCTRKTHQRMFCFFTKFSAMADEPGPSFHICLSHVAALFNHYRAFHRARI